MEAEATSKLHLGTAAGWVGPHLQLGLLGLLCTAESLLEAWCQLLIGVAGLLSGKCNIQPGLGLLERE